MTRQLCGAIVTVTSSTGDVLTCDQVKGWLKIDEDVIADDQLITDLIASAVTRYTEYTSRVPLQTTFDYVMDDFPAGALTLPRSPLVSIDSVKGYTDTDATDTGGTSMSSSDYIVDTANVPGRLVPLGGAVYPTAIRSANAAIVRFTAGETTNSTGVPEDIRLTIKTMVARAYEHRGDVVAMDHAMLAVLGGEDQVSPEWG